MTREPEQGALRAGRRTAAPRRTGRARRPCPAGHRRCRCPGPSTGGAACPRGTPGRPRTGRRASPAGRHGRWRRALPVCCPLSSRVPGQVGDHPGAAVEQACLRVEARARGEPDRARRVRERCVPTVCRELVDHHADADAATAEVRQRSPAVVDLQRAIAVGDASVQVLGYGTLGGVEVGRVSGPLVQADEQQRLPRRAAQQADAAAGPGRCALAGRAVPGGHVRRRDGLRRPYRGVGQPWLTDMVGHGDHGEREPRQATVEAMAEPVPVLAEAAARRPCRSVQMAEPRQRVRHPGQPVVEAEAACP